jgi:hypothetical protein
LNPQWIEDSSESDYVRIRFELLFTALCDITALSRSIQTEQVASVKVAMLEQMISVMNKARFYLKSLEESFPGDLEKTPFLS